MTDDPKDPVHMPSINEPPAQDQPAQPANPAPMPEDDEEEPPEAAHLDDPDEMEAEIEEAEDEDELVVTRTTHTQVHRGKPSKTLPKHRKK